MASLPYAEGGLEFLVADLQSLDARPDRARGVPRRLDRAAQGDRGRHRRRSPTPPTSRSTSSDATGAYRTWSTERHRATPPRFASASTRAATSRSSAPTASTRTSAGPAVRSAAAPHQRSLNLGGFDVQRAADWAGHRAPRVPARARRSTTSTRTCAARASPRSAGMTTPGYQPTQRRARGRSCPTRAAAAPASTPTSRASRTSGRRRRSTSTCGPTSDSRTLVAGPFDPASVMLYRFPALFYTTAAQRLRADRRRRAAVRRRQARARPALPEQTQRRSPRSPSAGRRSSRRSRDPGWSPPAVSCSPSRARGRAPACRLEQMRS